MLRNQAPAPASRAKKRGGGALRDPEVRVAIGVESHGCANSRHVEGRFFVANIKLATLNAVKPCACPGKQDEEAGRGRTGSYGDNWLRSTPMRTQPLRRGAFFRGEGDNCLRIARMREQPLRRGAFLYGK